jgi:L-glyceraldehyde 3-phosphate reductase
VAEARGITLVQLAVAWTLRRPEMSSVLVGAKSVDQLEEHLKAVELEQIDAATASVAER